MLRKVYILAAIAATFMFIGCCRDNQVEHWNDDGRFVTIVDIDGNLPISSHFSILCDKATNMAYLFYLGTNRSALAAYLDAEGKPARCTEVHR